MRVSRRKHMCVHRGPVLQAQRTHERWSADFVRDQLFDGRPFRVLTVVDQFSRQTPLLEPRFSFGGRDVIAALDRAIAPLSEPVHRSPSPWITVPSSLPRRLRNGRTAAE